MMKLSLMRTATGNPELPLLQRISSLELTASQIAAQILHIVQVTDTSQHQLFRGDYMTQALMVEFLQRNTTKGHE